MTAETTAERGRHVVMDVLRGVALFSHDWMKTFAFGPMEWLWRSLTYGEAPVIVRSKTVTV